MTVEGKNAVSELIKTQKTTPNTVGNSAERSVHFILPVSFFIVIRVVEHGQCISENSITFMAVTMFQPFEISMLFNSEIFGTSVKTPCDKYAISIIGITISFAGKPKINAIKIMPSNPIKFPIGFKKLPKCVKSVPPQTETFAISHIIRPAGAETVIARPKTNSVLSKTERTKTLPICGTLYGGSSNVNEDGTPFKTVTDKSFDAKNVIKIPKRIIKSKTNALENDSIIPVDEITNIEIRDISVGKRPLHGTKLLVKIAISLSLGESIILHPTTPAALHPNPIHIVSACFPQALHFLKHLSRLNAILGRYPKSSKSVKSGKKIAIGGSITDVTHTTIL